LNSFRPAWEIRRGWGRGNFLESVSRLDLLHFVEIIVHEAVAGRLAPSKLSAEAEQDDAALAAGAFVFSVDELLEVLPGDVRVLGVGHLQFLEVRRRCLTNCFLESSLLVMILLALMTILLDPFHPD
jgi:hypothetical protein